MFCKRYLLILSLVFLLSACVPAGQHSTSQNKAQKAEVHYKLGLAHLQANDPTSALKELLIAVKKAPSDSAIHVALAQAYQRKMAYSLAEKHYLKAIAYSDNDPNYQNNLAALYIDMQEWDKAVRYFDEAASNLLFSKPYVALAGKGFALYQKREYSAALDEYRKAITMAPKYARVYYLQSDAYLALNQPVQARAALAKAVDLAPGFVQAIYQLGVLSLKDRQTEEAKTRFEKVIELSPTSEWGLKAAEMLRTLNSSDVNSDGAS